MIKKITWSISIGITLLLLAKISMIIYGINKSYQPNPHQLATPQQTVNYLENFKKLYPHEPKGYYVPTGIYIQSLKFVSPYTVHLSGYIWQKYEKSFPSNYRKGFVFPEATRLQILDSYEQEKAGYTVTGWHFDGEFTQPFDYSKYPVDNKIVRLRIWAKDFDKEIILTPDLTSYTSTRPGEKFGLDPDIVLSGYKLLETFFEYKISRYDTNFGLGYQSGNFPVLSFNIPLKRNVFTAFIVNLLPLILVLVLSFGLLQIMTINEKDRSKYGFTLAAVANVCSALLFVILLSHIRLRETMMFDNIIYLEFIYFISYFAILYTVVLGFTVMKIDTKHTKLHFLFYQDSLFIKALYLPIIFALILFITEWVLV